MMAVHRELDPYERWNLVSYKSYAPLEQGPTENARGVEYKGAKIPKWRIALSRFFYEDRVEPVRPSELEAASHGHHEALESRSVAQLTQD